MNLQQQAAHDQLLFETRRHFLRNCATGLGGAYIGTLGANALAGGGTGPVRDPAHPLSELAPHFAPRAKRVIFLHMIGAPSQLELFDYKPELERLNGQDCPQSFLEGKRFAFIQGVPKMLGPQYAFKQHGQSGAWVSDRLPHFSKVVDDVCFVKSMHTNQFNHGPAQLMVHSGFARMGMPSMGSWVSWGLGTTNEDLPGFMVLLSGGRIPRVGKSLWGSGFLPSVYQGVQCQSKGDPVLNIRNPSGMSAKTRRAALDAIGTINAQAYNEIGDPEIMTRIAQYEMAYRMQTSVPEVMDITDEPKHVHEMYGTQPGKESFANNCLLARRLAEKGVRFIQLFDWGWDSHGASGSEALNGGFKNKCKHIDKPMSALLMDLKQRGMLEDTLVVWGGEFGRTPMRENRGGETMKMIGRDHNPSAFTMWMAGGGIKPGLTYGESDPIGYQAAVNPVSVHDMHATMLHALGFDHHRLTFHVAGLDHRLTNVTQPSKVIHDLMA